MPRSRRVGERSGSELPSPLVNHTEPTVAPIGQSQIEICHQSFGDPADETILLVMGFTAQMISWPEGFIEELVARDFHVVIFDNRDIGLSAKTVGEPPNAAALLARARNDEDISGEVPYALVDMAADAIGVLDHYGVDNAHVVGASMGGMIVQEIAINFADRVRSATSIMSTTGNTEVGQADPTAMGALLTPPPEEREAILEHMVMVNRVIGGPLWNADDAMERSIAAYERSFHPVGAAFQLAAIAASGDRTEQLASVDVPFLVIHGAADSLIAPSGAVATAEAVPGADLVIFAAMGHDLPTALWPQISDAIMGIARRPAFA